MFNFIKKFFAKEEIIEKISPENLEQWFEERAKLLEGDIKTKITSLKKEFIEKIRIAENTLGNLEKAKLRNPNISVREIQFMEGNRKSYLQKTSYFLKQIEDIIDFEINFFLHPYKEYVENFAKSTSRPYTILQEFFANELRGIAIKIRDIDRIVEKIKNDEEIHSYSRIELIKKELASIENRKKKKKELSSSIKQVGSNLNKLEIEKKELQKQKQEIISSKEYKALVDIGQEKKETEAEIKKFKDDFYMQFSPLQRVLRKYQRMAYQYDKLIEHYHTDALNAMVTDFSLKIVEILKGMTKQIKEGKLQDKKSEKILALTANMNERYFTDFLKKYNSALKKKNELERKDKESRIKQELGQVNEKMDEIKSKENDLKSKLSMLKNELESINIEHMREKLKENIGNVLKLKIEFV